MASQAAPLPGLGPLLRAQIRYQVTLVMRTPRAFILALVVPGIMLGLEAQVEHAHTHVATATIVSQVAGLSVFGTLSIAYFTYAAGLVVAREDGVLRRWHAMPLPPWVYFAGRIVAFVVLADISGLILLTVGVLMASLHLTAVKIAGFVAADTLGALTLASTGTAITPLITSAQGANPVLTLSYLPLLIFSGGLGTFPGLPHWLTSAMTYLPVQPVVHAVTHTLQQSGRGLALMSGHDLAVLAGWALGGLLLSVRFFRWDPTRPTHARHAGAEPSADRVSTHA